MKNLTLGFKLLIVLSLFLASCSNGVTEKISRKWKLSEMKNPQIDREIANYSNQIKAIGDSANAATDTTKKNFFAGQKVAMEQTMKMMQDDIAKRTNEYFMDFRKDGSYEVNIGSNS